MANEKRLIYAEEAIELINGLESLPWEEETEELVNSLTTVDAVEVVRCKDCKNYIQFLLDEKECRCTIFSGCYDRPYPTNPNDFCSYGERREA